MEIKETQDTTSTTYKDALDIRRAVFVVEQQVPLDLEIDQYEADCTHFVLYTSVDISFDDDTWDLISNYLYLCPYGWDHHGVSKLYSCKRVNGLCMGWVYAFSTVIFTPRYWPIV